MISDQDAEDAVDYLRAHAIKIAQAKATAAYMDDFKKVVKANCMKEHIDESLGAQEREAYADPRYKEHLKAKKEADEHYEYLRWMMEAAQAKFQAWQTQSANSRKGV